MSFRKKKNRVSPCWQGHYYFPPTSQGFHIGGRSSWWHQQPTECPMSSLVRFFWYSLRPTYSEVPRWSNENWEGGTQSGIMGPGEMEAGWKKHRHSAYMESWLSEWTLLRISLCLETPWFLGQEAEPVTSPHLLDPASQVLSTAATVSVSTFLKHFYKTCNIPFQCFASF